MQIQGKNRIYEGGYVALMATIIIAAVLLVMSVEGGLAGWHARFNVLGTEAKEQATSLAQGCADQALSAIVTDPSYTGDSTTTNDIGTCHVFPIQFNTPITGVVTIKTQAEVRDSFANLEMQMDMSEIHIDSIPAAPTRGTLVVITNVVNDGSGIKHADDFTMHVPGGDPSDVFQGDEGGVAVTVAPGSYSVTEDSLPGYSKSLSTNCVGNIGPGDIKFCTITNNDITTTLTVLVNVTNDNGGALTYTDFPLTMDGTAITPGTEYSVSAGPHSVNASAVLNYTASVWGYQCASTGNVTLAEGQNKTCIINFNDDPPPAPSCADTVMVLDRTGSMSSTDLTNERTAANSLIDLYAGVALPALPPHMGAGSIGGLDGSAASIPVLGQLSTIYANLKSAVNSITGSNSSVGSNLSAGITVANAELNSVRHVAGNKKVLIMVSDGDPNQPTGTMNYDTGFKSATSSVQDATSSVWASATGAYADGGADANTLVTGSTNKERYFNFGFGNGTGLPTGATINGIQAQVDAWNTSSATGTLATTTRTPTALGTYSEWTPNTGTEVNAVTSNDGDTTYIDTSVSLESFTVSNAGIPAGSIINSVTITAVAKSTVAGAVMQLVTEKGGAPSIGSNNTLTTSYTTYTRTLNTDPSTGSAWTLAEVNAWTTKFGVRTTNAAQTPRVTQFYVTVNYSPGTNSGFKVPSATHTPNNWDTNTVANIQTSNNVYVSDNDNDQQGYSFGGSGLGIPAGVTITGIEVIAEARSSDSSGCEIGAELSSNGSTFTNFGDTAALTGSDNSVTLGGSSVMWGRSWTPADFNSTNFTLRIAGIDPGGSCSGASLTSVDLLQTRVSYTLPAVNTSALQPTALGTYSEWTPNTGTEVNAVTSNDGDTTYIDTSVSLESFTVSNAGIPAGSIINSVTITAVAKSTVAGAVMQLVTEKGGAPSIGSNNTLTTSYTTYTRTLNTDPSTGSAWTLAEVNAWTTKFGVRTTNAAQTPRVTQVSVLVNYTLPPTPTICQLGVDLSWNGGTNWSSEKTQNLSSTETTYAIPSSGGSTDKWGTHTWVPTDFSNTNFRARVHAIDPGSNCDNSAVEHLDWLQMKVYYTQTVDPIQASLNAADTAKKGPDGIAGNADDTDIFTIHFGSDPGPYQGRKLLANLASGTTSVTYNSVIHENGSLAQAGGVVTGDSGLLPPTTAATTPSQWTNPTRAFASDNSYATDNVSGHLQGFTNFGVNIPPTASVNGIAVEVEAKSSDSSGCQVGAELSSDNGATFTAANLVAGVSGSDQVYTLGGSATLWGRAWTHDNLLNGNFVVRLKNIDPGNNCTNNSTLSVDRVRTRVYYSVNTENGDGDNFFISPTSADMDGIFDFIGAQVCPAIGFAAGAEAPTQGSVKVVTRVVTNNGGSLLPGDVSIAVTPPSASPNAFTGSVSGTDVTLDPGSYDVGAVTVPDGFAEIKGAECSSSDPDVGDIEAGEVRVCVLTYDDIPPPPPPPNLTIHLGSWKELPAISP